MLPELKKLSRFGYQIGFRIFFQNTAELLLLTFYIIRRNLIVLVIMPNVYNKTKTRFFLHFLKLIANIVKNIRGKPFKSMYTDCLKQISYARLKYLTSSLIAKNFRP